MADSIGPKGDTGDTGVAGVKGDTGLTGATGAGGLVGERGPRGEAGPRGPQGKKGPKGDKGDPGERGGSGGPGGPGGPGGSGVRGEPGEQGPVGPAPRTHLPWLWVTLAAIMFTMALAGLTIKLNEDVKHASASRADVAATAARVILLRCQSANSVTVVLRNAILNERAVLEQKHRDNEVTDAAFSDRYAALTGNLKKLEPQNCKAQAALIRRSAGAVDR